MTRFRARIALVALAAALAAVPLGAAGQFEEFRYNTALRILQNYNLKQGETVREIQVIGGDAKIEGRVTGDVVVVLGRLELASTGVIDGQLISVAGTVEVAEGAKVGGDFTVVGEVETPPSFSPGGQHIVIGTAGLATGLRSIVPWLTHGLLLGRPIVPWLGWVWMTAAVFFFINLCLNLLFDGPVRACTATLHASPFSSFMAGLLVLLLAGPICLLLGVSVIGIAVVPFVLAAIVAAAVLGRIAFARWLGMSIVHQGDPADRAASLRSFLLGSALMGVSYVIPVIGFMVWILAGVFGLGAATLAFHAAYRRENPKPPKKVKGEVPAPPTAPVDAPGSSGLQPGDSLALQSAVPLETDIPPVLPADAATADDGYQAMSAEFRDPVSFPKAVFVERLAGFALDAIVIMIVAQFFEFDRHDAPFERLTVFLALAYHVGFWTWRGTTPGGMICQLRVVRTDGKPLAFAESLVRGLTGILSLAVVGLGFLWILRDPERQAWHDRVAGTYVVKVPRAYPT